MLKLQVRVGVFEPNIYQSQCLSSAPHTTHLVAFGGTSTPGDATVTWLILRPRVRGPCDAGRNAERLLFDLVVVGGQAAAMAREVIERLVDDIDGSEATQSVVFGVDSLVFQIDLNDAHAAQLRGMLGPYVEVARRVRGQAGGGRGGARRAVADKDRNARIRQWALDQGVEVPGRGRIAGAVQNAYDAGDVAGLYAGAGLELPEEPAPKRSRRRAASAEFSG